MKPEEIEKLAERAARWTCWSTDSPQRVFQYGWEAGFTEALRRSASLSGDAPVPTAPLDKHKVEWVVNDLAELGVKIGNQFFFLYKGESYQGGTKWRHVLKREFSECCHPVGMKTLPSDYARDSDGWQPIPDTEYRCETHSWTTCHGSTYCRDCTAKPSEQKSAEDAKQFFCRRCDENWPDYAAYVAHDCL